MLTETINLSASQYHQFDNRTLADKLQAQVKLKIDDVVDTRTMRAHVVETQTENQTAMKVVKLEFQNRDQELVSMPLTNWAHKQVAEKCGIPTRYYARMLSGEDHHELLVNNINEWLGDKDRRMVRTLDGKIRAILSDRYKCLDNYDLAMLAYKRFVQHGAAFEDAHLSDTRMYIRAAIPHLSIDIDDYKNGINPEGYEGFYSKNSKKDILTAGLILSNSEVGAGRFLVQPFIKRLVCSNGMIGMSTFSRVHLGSTHELGEVISDRTNALKDEALWSEVGDIIDAAFDGNRFLEWVGENVMEKKSVEIITPTEAIGNLTSHYKMDDSDKEDIINQMMTGKDTSQWGLINAVTATANMGREIEEQLALQKIGGELTEMKVKDFNRIIKQE